MTIEKPKFKAKSTPSPLWMRIAERMWIAKVFIIPLAMTEEECVEVIKELPNAFNNGDRYIEHRLEIDGGQFIFTRENIYSAKIPIEAIIKGEIKAEENLQITTVRGKMLRAGNAEAGCGFISLLFFFHALFLLIGIRDFTTIAIFVILIILVIPLFYCGL